MGLASLLTAASESAVGLWLRHFSSHAQAPWLGMLVGLLALRLLFSAWRDLTGEHLALRSRTDFHHHAWNALQPPFQEQLQALEAGTRAALQLRTGILSLALLVPTMAILAPSLALGALLCAIMLGLASRTRSQALRPLVHADMEAQAHFEAEELWACRALPEAIAGGFATKISKQRWKESLAFLRIRLAHAVQWQKYQSLMEVAAHGVSILLCALAFLQWRTGDLPIGQFLSFLALALLAYRPVREAGRALPAVTRAAQTLLPRSISPQPRHGDRLSLDHLEFGFGPSLFHHLSFSLSLGEVALLHGPNGCGKSTLLRLCAGQLRPRSGAIVLPAGRIHWVDQETVLPPLSLRRWTGLIKPPTTAACQAFHSRHIAPFLPDLEWNTPLVQGGSNLSRGQRIRLRLWVLACQPGSLWLLDEPLSALPRPERLDFLKALLACRQDACVLMADQEIPDLPSDALATPGLGPSIHRILGL